MTQKTTTKKRKNLILSTKAERTRKSFQIAFLTKTFKQNLKISNNRERKKKKRNEKKSYKTIKKISLRLLNEFYKNSKCLSKHQKQKRRQKTKHLINNSTFLCLH